MRGTLWELLKTMVFKWISMHKLIIVFFFISQEFGLNQDWKTGPVIAKSQTCDCKVTKTQKRLVPMQQSNWLLDSYDWPCGGISARGLSKSNLLCGGWLIGWYIPRFINNGGPTHFSIAKRSFLCEGWLIPNGLFIPTWQYFWWLKLPNEEDHQMSCGKPRLPSFSSSRATASPLRCTSSPSRVNWKLILRTVAKHGDCVWLPARKPGWTRWHLGSLLAILIRQRLSRGSGLPSQGGHPSKSM